MSDNEQEQDNKNNKKPKKNPQNSNIIAIVLVAMLIFGISTLPQLFNKQSQKELTYSEFIQAIDNKAITDIEISNNGQISGTLLGDSEFSTFRTSIPYYDQVLLDRLIEKDIAFKKGKQGDLTRNLLPFLPIVILIIFWTWMMRGRGMGGFGGFGKKSARKAEDTKEKITFANVAGQKEAKLELQEVVEFLKNPKRFSDVGARIPRGVLMVGEPGTGKTLLARATAGEADVPFFLIAASEFIELYVGLGAARVRDLFATARKASPSIIFIDEIDAVGGARGNGRTGGGGGHDEREQTLNQLLVEMDGFTGDSGVIVIAATNRADVLDPALLRPGRFDRQVTIELPDRGEREEILKLHAKKIKYEDNVDFNIVARATPGCSGADLANIINESALLAARNNREKVTQTDIEEAIDKSYMGAARKSRKISSKEKMATAYHEIGHALLHYYLYDVDPLLKVTVIPRGRALGVTFSLPEDDRLSMNRKMLISQIAILFGGYIAEQMIYSTTTTGTANDLNRATGMARRMVGEWGMGKTTGISAWGSQRSMGFFGDGQSPYSEKIAYEMDQDVNEILNSTYLKAKAILEEHRDQLELLSKELFEKETLSDAEVRVLLKLPPKPEKDEDPTDY